MATITYILCLCSFALLGEMTPRKLSMFVSACLSSANQHRAAMWAQTRQRAIWLNKKRPENISVKRNRIVSVRLAECEMSSFVFSFCWVTNCVFRDYVSRRVWTAGCWWSSILSLSLPVRASKCIIRSHFVLTADKLYNFKHIILNICILMLFCSIELISVTRGLCSNKAFSIFFCQYSSN